MGTIDAVIRESCAKYGDKTALRHKTPEGWQQISYRQLWESVLVIARWLRHEGFEPGDHAALLAPSSPQWVSAYLAILLAGGVVVPIDKDLKEAELRHILLDSDVRALFTTGHWLELVQEMVPELPELSLIIPLRPDLAALEQLSQEIHLPEETRQPSDTAAILYTSGTTGHSKGAMLSHVNILSNISAAIEHFGLDSRIHTLSFLPINHVFEQVCGVLLPLSLGGTVTFCESLKRLGDNLAEIRPTFFLAVPVVYRMLLDRIMKSINGSRMARFLFVCPITRPLIVARIRRIFGAGTIFISGGAALDPAIAEGLGQAGLDICQGYGITETSPVISAEQPGKKRAGSVGHPLKDVQVRILEPNEEGIGEILVKGPHVMQGYYKNPAATAEVLKDGWYHTGDLGKIDRDGFLSIRGRVKSLIVTANGKNVYPEEIENELLKSPFIAEVLVYGRMAGTAEEEIHAVVYPNQATLDDYCRSHGRCPLSEGDLEALLRMEIRTACSRLADYKRVRQFTIREDEFPKTSTRKIRRFASGTGISLVGVMEEENKAAGKGNG